MEAANPYAYCKLLSEEMLAKSYDVSKLLTRTVILPNVFGPEDIVINTMLRNSCCGSVFNFKSTAQSPFGFIENLSNGLILVAKQLSPLQTASPDPLLLVDFNCSLSELYSDIFHEAGVRVQPQPLCLVYLCASLLE